MVATGEGFLSGLAPSRLPQQALVLWNSHNLIVRLKRKEVPASPGEASPRVTTPQGLSKQGDKHLKGCSCNLGLIPALRTSQLLPSGSQRQQSGCTGGGRWAVHRDWLLGAGG